MTTNRSLNKLEFKAHMSIHNKTEVPETETHGATWTRDRLGKNHGVLEQDGSTNLWRANKKLALLFFIAIFSTGSVAVAGNSNTDMKFESDGFDERVLDEKLNPPDEPFTFYKDGDATVGLDEDATPNMNVHF